MAPSGILRHSRDMPLTVQSFVFGSALDRPRINRRKTGGSHGSKSEVILPSRGFISTDWFQCVELSHLISLRRFPRRENPFDLT